MTTLANATTEPTYPVLLLLKDLTPSPLASRLAELKAGPIFCCVTKEQYQELTGDQKCAQLNRRLALPATSRDNYDVYVTTADALHSENGAYNQLCNNYEYAPGQYEHLPADQRRDYRQMSPATVQDLIKLQTCHMDLIPDIWAEPTAAEYAEFNQTARNIGLTRSHLTTEQA